MKLIDALVFCCIALCVACNDPKIESRPYPSIDTDKATDINENGVLFHGEILALGSGGIKDYGFIYAEHENPTLHNSDLISLGKSPGKGKFSAVADRNLRNTGKASYFSTYAVTNDGTVVYGQQKSFISLGGKLPVISELKPSVGLPSDMIVIVGSGFSDYPLNNKVTFGNQSANVLSSSGDTIVCVVPVTPVGTVGVKVAVGDGTTSSKDFLIPETTFTSFTPEFVTFGDTVYLNGSNFPSTRQSMYVILLGRQPAIVKSTPTQLKLVIPNNVTKAESVINFSFGSTSTDSEKSIKLNAPVILGFSPPSGSPGEELGINGKYFNPVPQNNKVTIAGVDCPVLRADNKNLYIKIPAVATGFHNIDVTIVGQKGTSSAPLQVQ